MNTRWVVKLLFALAALYDGLLGIAFLFAGPALFECCRVPPPNHWGYIQFPAAVLIIFGLMFLVIALDPITNRNMILFGIMFKVAYAGVIFYYWLLSYGPDAAPLPNMWKPFAVADTLFAVAFLWAYAVLGKKSVSKEPPATEE